MSYNVPLYIFSLIDEITFLSSFCINYCASILKQAIYFLSCRRAFIQLREMLENILQHTSCITKKSLNYTIIFLPSTMQVPLFGTKLPSLRSNSNARRTVPPWKILNRSTVVIRKGEQRREQGASTDRLEFNDSSARYRYTHFIHASRPIPLDT